jgi:hypothetical protein
LGEQNIRVVGTKDITTEEDLDALIIGIRVTNEEPNGHGGNLRNWTPTARRRLIDTGFWKVHRELDRSHTVFFGHATFEIQPLYHRIAQS